jgi:uncharacterized protein
MDERVARNSISRRELIGTAGRAIVLAVALPPLLSEELAATLTGEAGAAGTPPNVLPGPDRTVIQPGRTYMNAWAGPGEPPWRVRRRPGEEEPAPAGPPPRVEWVTESGPGTVTFADANAMVTSAVFSAPGTYVLRLTATDGAEQASSTVTVKVAAPEPMARLGIVHTRPTYRIHNRLWNQRTKALIASWIPHCIDMINRTDLQQGPGGMDNFDEAARALRGLPHGRHKGYVFSNAWVHQTVEAMCIALMVDPQGDAEILAAHAKFRATLEDWIPRILAAQHQDGYLHTAFTLRDVERWPERWSARGRAHHEGYVAGYFIESALNHHVMTEGRDTRLYDAAKKLADCWDAHIGPAPRQEWFDGHQEMEMALVRFGEYVNEVEGNGHGDRYIDLARFLLDCRRGGSEYDQSHLPVQQQYEAVGHAVRAVYNYAAMADVALHTGDTDYLSAVHSIWDNLINRKYYITGGIGSGETSEGFGGDYSLRNNSYCESCSSCGQLFFQAKMNRMYGDARYADLLEETMYNALLGSYDLPGKNFYYTNPLSTNAPRHPWHNCPCCVGNIPRTLLMLPTWSYARDADGIYVNLFIGTTATIQDVAGTDVEMVQTTEYPWDGAVTITVNPKRTARFSVHVRMPRRDVSELYTSQPDANGIDALSVNGQRVTPQVQRGYAVINREWKAGDRIEFQLPMKVQRIHSDDRIVGNRGRVALRYGPLMYNIENEDQDITKVLPPNAELTSEWREDLLQGVRVIRGRFADGSPMLAIPNYARDNRTLHEPPPPPPPAGSPRPAPRPPTSIVWIVESPAV